MEEKVIGITLTKQDKINVRTAAAVQNIDSSTFIRSIVEDKLNDLNIPIPEDFEK